MIVLLGAQAGAQTARGTAHTAASSTTTTFMLQPGVDASWKHYYTFESGWAYTITISGTITRAFGDSTPPPTCVFDAFWSNCYETGGPPGPTWQPSAQAVYTGMGTSSQDDGLPGAPSSAMQPAFDSGHSYTWLVPSSWFHQTETLWWWALPEGQPSPYTNTTYSGSLRVTIVSHPPAPTVCKAPWAASDPTAHATALNEVHVVCAQPDCQFHKGGTPADAWLPAEKDTVLKGGDEVSCDPDGALTLAFADNSTVVVSKTTQLKIGSFFTEGGVVRTEILLKMGEIAAQVNKSEATKSDFRIKSPSEDETRGARDASAAAVATGVAVRPGARVKVFYDPGSKTELVSVLRGKATLTPKNPRLPIVTVRTGREVEFTRTYESPVAPIGKAGARGGVDILQARDLVLAVIARKNTACNTSTPRSKAYSIAAVRGGWVVSVKLIGKLHGTSVWRVAGAHVVPANKLAKTLARGCA